MPAISRRIDAMTNQYRRLPSVDRVLADEVLQRAAIEVGSATATEAARLELAERRAALKNGGADVSVGSIASAAAERAYASLRASLRPVINATGVIIHTNLGRAPLSDAAIGAMSAVARGYSNLEFELEAGERGSRYDHLEALLCRVTGAEAAVAINNNAAALLLALSALAQDREVVISRGQLVEIGGGFRIPDVMTQSGARLIEVGTTNRTYVRDYEDAIGEATVALMRVHSSNFRVVGFVESAALEDLAALAHSRGLLLLDDLGSGCLLDTRIYGLSEEPTPQDSIRAGADLVMFSGDKLLGGPQAGVVVGKKELIAKLRRHPLARALRMDKASIAGLNATLLHYAKGEAEREVPVWRMISTQLTEISARARRWARLIGEGATVIDGRSMIGGGSLPEESLATKLVAVPAAGGAALEALAKRLRQGETPIVGRIEDGRLLLDPRTVASRDDAVVVGAVKAALAG
jgi:L-seryl-tRNA(Ser) seleniumtransferase